MTAGYPVTTSSLELPGANFAGDREEGMYVCGHGYDVCTMVYMHCDKPQALIPVNSGTLCK